MFPEAGGSSSFARRAFNEFWSFFAAWAGMLTYTVTIAISAFFVPHYIGGVFEFADVAPARAPATSSPRSSSSPLLAGVNVFGAKESTGINVTLAVVDFLTQLLLVLIGAILVFSPEDAGRQRRSSASRPTWSDFILAIPIGMLAYTGIETVSNMAEEAKDEAHTIPAAINRVRLAVFAIYFTLPAVALSALPVTQAPTASTRRSSGLTEEEGGFAGDPVLGVVKQHRPRAPPGRRPRSTSACSPRRSSSSPRTRASSASRGSSTRWASTARCPTRCAACTRATARRGSASSSSRRAAIVLILPGQETLLGSIYSFGALLSLHDGARRRRAAARHAPRRRARPTAGRATCRSATYDAPLFALVGGSFTAIAFVVIVVLNPGVAAIGVGWLLVGIVRLRARSAAARGSTSPRRTRSRSPQPVVDHEAEYDSVLVHVGDASTTSSRRHRGQARGAQAPRHPRARDDHRAERAADRRARCPRRRRPPTRSSSRPSCRAAAASPGTGRRSAPARPGRRIIEEAQDMRAAAVVMALPAARRGHVGVRQDDRDRARRAALPRDHRVAAAGAPHARPRAQGEGDGMSPITPCSPALMVAARRGDHRADDRRRRRAARRRDRARRAVRRGRRRPPLGGAAAMNRARAACRRLDPPDALKRGTGSPAAVRHRPGLPLGVAVLRARRHRRQRARAHLARPARRLAVLRRCSSSPTWRARRCTRSAAARR